MTTTKSPTKNVYKVWDDIKDDIAELALLADKMFEFSNTTRNLHKNMEDCCTELKKRSVRLILKNKSLSSFVEVAG